MKLTVGPMQTWCLMNCEEWLCAINASRLREGRVAIVQDSEIQPPRHALGFQTSKTISSWHNTAWRGSASSGPLLEQVSRGGKGPPTIALKGLVHNPDKIGRSKGPRADFIRTKWPKIGGRGGRKIRTNQDGGAGGLVHLPRGSGGRAAAGGGK